MDADAQNNVCIYIDSVFGLLNEVNIMTHKKLKKYTWMYLVDTIYIY